jgi:hypothetical protein
MQLLSTCLHPHLQSNYTVHGTKDKLTDSMYRPTALLGNEIASKGGCLGA